MRSALLAVALLLPVVGQAQVKLLRYPTYSKGKVAFSYLGDIWIASENGGDVQRLTVNKARDQYPRFFSFCQAQTVMRTQRSHL